MNNLFFSTSQDNLFKQDVDVLKNRWLNDKVWKSFKTDILNVLLNKGSDKELQNVMKKNFLIKVFANITHDHHFDVVDLRGIELKDINIGEYDFAYCCFDFAVFDKVSFDKTYLQYSSLNKVVAKNCNFKEVQASPISAVNANFENTVFENTPLFHSDFSGSKFDNVTMDETSSKLILL